MTRDFADVLRDLGELRALEDASPQTLLGTVLANVNGLELKPDDDDQGDGERAELGAEVVDVLGKLAQLARVREILSRSPNYPRTAHEMDDSPNSATAERVEFVPLRRRPPGTALPSSWVRLSPGVFARKARRAV